MTTPNRHPRQIINGVDRTLLRHFWLQRLTNEVPKRPADTPTLAALQPQRLTLLPSWVEGADPVSMGLGDR